MFCIFILINLTKSSMKRKLEMIDTMLIQSCIYNYEIQKK